MQVSLPEGPRRLVLTLRGRRASRAAAASLADVAAGPRPIVAGPFVSEVGFELLYWIPLLRWFRERYGLGREEIVAVSRGGADAWYADVAGTYLDVLDWLTPEDLRAWRERRLASAARSEKQVRIDTQDRDLFARACHGLGLSQAGWLHPSLMYRLFHAAWIGSGDLGLVLRHTAHRRLSAPPPPPELPDGYVALKAYFSDCFPDTAANRGLLERLSAELSETGPVVLLRAPISLSEHHEVALTGTLDAAPFLDDPRRNLALQTAIVAGARSFTTTYGGFGYLGPFLGVPTCSFYSDPTFNGRHLEVLQRVSPHLDVEPQSVTPHRLPALASGGMPT